MKKIITALLSTTLIFVMCFRVCFVQKEASSRIN